MRASKLSLILLLVAFTASIFHSFSEENFKSKSSQNSSIELIASSASDADEAAEASQHFCHLGCCPVIGYTASEFSFRFNSTSLEETKIPLLFDGLAILLYRPPIS